MSDSGEGLVDATSRLAERMEEMEEDRRRARVAGPRIDPEKARVLESLRLAKTEMQRQFSVMTHEARRQQLTSAMAEIDRRLADLEQTA
ncbi:MAG: hypothetical protein NTY02_16945 [Acidobacteria bacterium]|nr:hypothetical protein [Acidobacteriota bacterium]